MSTKLFDIKDIKKIQKAQDYKFVGLFDVNDNPIIKFNPNKASVGKRLREIETRLLSEGLPDGYYHVKAKNTVSKTVIPDSYLVMKGDGATTLEEQAPLQNGTVTILQQPSENASKDHLLTYDNALKLEIKVAKLEMENLALTNDNNKLEDKIEELEKADLLSENPTATLASNSMTFIENIVEMAAPLWDKHLDVKEKTLRVRAMEAKARIGNEGNPKNPAANGVQEQKINTEETYIEGEEGEELNPYQQWIASHYDEENPTAYEALVNIYQTADSEEEFKEQLRELDEQKFVEFSQFIHNAGQ